MFINTEGVFDNAHLLQDIWKHVTYMPYNLVDTINAEEKTHSSNCEVRKPKQKVVLKVDYYRFLGGY